ncbi:hypothetical protein [Bacillus licheniformis]|uniref:hypothetical protein n=1 Tax=Bacillus licheniformis TaxID=1402 RepID=UPI002E22A993|nr:hypothetical protein [Bacillus licheniformis]
MEKLSKFSPEERTILAQAVRDLQSGHLALYLSGVYEIERIAGEQVLNEILDKLDKIRGNY